MHKYTFVSAISVLLMAFVFSACGDKSTGDPTGYLPPGVYDSSNQYIGSYLGIFYNDTYDYDAVQVKTDYGYIVSFNESLSDFQITTIMGWITQDETDHYIYEADKEDDSNYVYFNSSDDDFSDAQKFWVYEDAPLSTITISGGLNINGYPTLQPDESSFYKLVEKSRSDIGLPGTIVFPLKVIE